MSPTTAARPREAATGALGCGTFFTFDPSSRQDNGSLLVWKDAKTTAQLPNSLLFHNGSFYGTTQDGGTSASLGTVFKITPPAREGGKWNETILYRFHGPPNDGSSPSQITIDASGAIYGTAGDGGPATKCALGCGAIFKLTPAPGKGEWHETILHSFAGVPDGAAPSTLILAPNGDALRRNERRRPFECVWGDKTWDAGPSSR